MTRMNVGNGRSCGVVKCSAVNNKGATTNNKLRLNNFSWRVAAAINKKFSRRGATNSIKKAISNKVIEGSSSGPTSKLPNNTIKVMLMA